MGWIQPHSWADRGAQKEGWGDRWHAPASSAGVASRKRLRWVQPPEPLGDLSSSRPPAARARVTESCDTSHPQATVKLLNRRPARGRHAQDAAARLQGRAYLKRCDRRKSAPIHSCSGRSISSAFGSASWAAAAMWFRHCRHLAGSRIEQPYRAE